VTRHDRLPDRLRQAYASLDPARRGEERCPEPETIWDAIHARLTPGASRSVVSHIASCPSCAYDWRIAMRSERRVGAATDPSASRPPSTIGPGLVAVAAVILGAAFLAVFRSGLPVDLGETYRAPERQEIVSLVPEDESLPRENAVLSWTAVEEDARYTVAIDTLDLTPVDRAREIAATEYRIAPEKLGGLESGEIIVWTVEARLLDGRRVKSEAFRHRIR
jgi:hypothetical protein